ncbi:hypothetical protein C5167_028114 [Papaver somniferum]|nr:hypothetical protein C5167_028114 [Papaver somniferum]
MSTSFRHQLLVFRLQPVTLELGGKSPSIFEDTDLGKASEWTMFGCFWTNGQMCSATSRLIVHVNWQLWRTRPRKFTDSRRSITPWDDETTYSATTSWYSRCIQ